MTGKDILPAILAFAITAVATGFLAPWLRERKFDQTEREEGVESHLKKAGTPTMGGIAIILGILIATLVTISGHGKEGVILFLTVAFGAIGFLDDYLKVFLKRSDGLIAWQKLLLEIGVTAVFLLLLTKAAKVPLAMLIPFAQGKTVSIGIFAIPFAFVVILATVNAVNFTDGLDGLASGVTIVVALFFALIAHWRDGGSITPMSLAVVGALMGFLLFNAYPAKIFMGDTGSLALGGFVAGAAYVLQMPLFIPIIGLIYTIELLSVVIQVSYFKVTHGKRVFKMTPIHHHYELSGWSETRIVTTFSVITAVLCFLALI